LTTQLSKSFLPQEALKKHKITDAFSLFVHFLGVLCTQDSKKNHYQLSIVNYFVTLSSQNIHSYLIF